MLFAIGDYVIADHSEFDTFPGTFRISEFTRNLFGEPLVRITDITDRTRTLTFYPREISYEDGTRPSE